MSTNPLNHMDPTDPMHRTHTPHEASCLVVYRAAENSVDAKNIRKTQESVRKYKKIRSHDSSR